MRIAIVIPPVCDLYFTPQRSSFLGARTLASLCERKGVEHRIFNAVRSRGRRLPLPPELAHLSPYLGTAGFFSGFYRFGVTAQHLADEVCAYGPDLVLVSCIAFCYAAEAIEVIDVLKRRMPGVTVAAGGPGPSAYPGYYLEHSPVDFAVEGEAEAVFDTLLCGPRPAPGVRSRRGGACVSAVQGVREAARGGVAGEDFQPVLARTGSAGGIDYFSTSLTRGCPLDCPFCSVKSVFPVFRKAPLTCVERLFATLAGSPAHVHVNFEDDNITLDFDYFSRVIDLLVRATGGRCSFSMENGTGFGNLDRDRIAFMKAGGLKQLNLSLVSPTDEALARNRRRYTIRDFRAVAAWLVEFDVRAVVYLISGLPGDTVELMMEGLALLAEYPFLAGISTFYPVPGIDGYRDTSLFDAIPPRITGGSAFYRWNGMTTGELIGVFLAARHHNLSKKLQ